MTSALATRRLRRRQRGPPGRAASHCRCDKPSVPLLNLARTGAATTRQELERQSELGRAVVTDRLPTLMSLGLLREGALGQASGGRAPRHVEFRSDAGLILLAVLDQFAIAVGLADLSGRVLSEHHEAIELTVGPQAILERLVTLFGWLLQDHQTPVWGIGIAAPVPVSVTVRQRFAAPTLRLQAWQDFPLVESLAVRFGAPVYVRSNVQMMTMGGVPLGSRRQHFRHGFRNSTATSRRGSSPRQAARRCRRCGE